MKVAIISLIRSGSIKFMHNRKFIFKRARRRRLTFNWDVLYEAHKPQITQMLSLTVVKTNKNLLYKYLMRW